MPHTMRALLTALSILAALIAACSPGPPDIQTEVDWCYIFDFTVSDYDANIVTGTWINAEGIQTVDGVLSASYTHPLTVEPAVVIVRGTRPAGVLGDIAVAANASVFGVPVNIDETLPGIINDFEVAVSPEAANLIGNSWNVSLASSQPILIQELEIRGLGANPFPTTSCNGTATPQGPTSTIGPTETDLPTETALPTDTPEPTETIPPTPTPTAVCTPGTWTQIFEFNTDLEGWAATNSEHGANLSGGRLYGLFGVSSITRVGVKRTVVIPSGSSITNVSVTSGGFRDGDTVYIVLNGSLTSYGSSFRDGSGEFVRSRSQTLTGTSTLEFDFHAAGDWDEVIYIQRITISGTGAANIFTGESCGSTYTPTVSRTPTVTRTPSITRTPTNTRTTNPALFTPTRTPTGTRTASRTPSRTPLPINTLPPTLNATQIQATNTALAILNPTGTPGPTSTGTRTPEPSPTMVPTPGVGDDQENSGEINILNSIGEFFNWVRNTITGFFDWIGAAFEWISVSFQNFLTSIGNFFQQVWGIVQLILRFIGELFATLGMLLSLIWNFIALVGAWIGQFFSLFTALINTWNNVSPTPLPFLPQCVSNPMSSDICAVWYILTNTIFSGQLGTLIMPLVVILIDLTIVLVLVKKVRSLIFNRVEGVTR